MSHQARLLTRGNRLLSYSWAELGSLFRNALKAGNQSLAARLKQAIDLKKEIRRHRKKGLALPTE